MNYSPQLPVDFTYIYTSPICSLYRQNISCLLLPLYHSYILELMLESFTISYLILHYVIGGAILVILILSPQENLCQQKRKRLT